MGGLTCPEKLHSTGPSTTTGFHNSTGIIAIDCIRSRNYHCIHTLNEYSIKTRLPALEHLCQNQRVGHVGL